MTPLAILHLIQNSKQLKLLNRTLKEIQWQIKNNKFGMNLMNMRLMESKENYFVDLQLAKIKNHKELMDMTVNIIDGK